MPLARSSRSRLAVGGAAGVVVLALVGTLVAVFGFGNGDNTTPTTTITVPPDTTATASTVAPPQVSTPPSIAALPRPWRTGFANGVMPLQSSDADLAKDLDGMAATGARWLRLDFYWPTIQQAGPQSWDWSGTDRVVGAALLRGMHILAMPAYSPTWARPAGTEDHHPPLNPDWYARFVYEAVKRYAPLGVHAWEIWNEPNVDVFWQPKPDPAAYAALLERAAVAIKSVDPLSTVITGGLAPALDKADGSSLSARTFLSRVYDAGASGAFDAVGLHPYSFPAMPLDPSDWNTFYNAPTLYQVMVDHGDAKKRIWGTEFGAPTGVDLNAGTPQFQNDVLLAGYRDWMKWSFTGPLFWYSWRDTGVNAGDRESNFGLLAHDGTPKPALNAFDDVVRQLNDSARRASLRNK
jgi:hypothetical protein